MYIGELGDVEVSSASVVDDEENLWTKKREIKNTMNIAIAIGLTKKLLSPVHISCKNIAWIASIKTTIPNVAIAIVFESATLLRIGSFLQNTSRTPIIKRLNKLLPKTSPAAMSGWSSSCMEEIPVANSGIEDFGIINLSNSL